jgi:hypothetical protein
VPSYRPSNTYLQSNYIPTSTPTAVPSTYYIITIKTYKPSSITGTYASNSTTSNANSSTSITSSMTLLSSALILLIILLFCLFFKSQFRYQLDCTRDDIIEIVIK